MKLLSGRNPLLYSYQKSMPTLPVPDLDKTVSAVCFLLFDLNIVQHCWVFHSKVYQKSQLIYQEESYFVRNFRKGMRDNENIDLT